MSCGRGSGQHFGRGHPPQHPEQHHHQHGHQHEHQHGHHHHHSSRVHPPGHPERQPIFNPRIPYVGPIHGGITPGIALQIQGVVSPRAKAFEINFKKGQSDGDDIAFHFSLRIGQKVVIKSFRNGKWEREENASDKPFACGAPFHMFIVINSEEYEVYVNGMRHSKFKHLIPLEEVSVLEIRGDVSIILCGFINNWSSSSFAEERRQPGKKHVIDVKSPIQLEISHPVINPAIPYVGAIPGGIRPEMAVYFQGSLPANSKGFAINFQTGPSSGDDIAFHFNSHIGQKVLLNSYRNGKWEKEECISNVPFTSGAPFSMSIVIKSEAYEVYVNGIQQCTFKHRIPIQKVSTLDVHGDVSMTIFDLIDDWSRCSFLKEKKHVIELKTSALSQSPIQFEISNPVTSPAIPYVGAITGGIRPYMGVYFQGTVLANSKNFEINFKTGESTGDDIAFHFKPQLGQKVTLNSFRNGTWEKEEPASDKPFASGAPFNMFALINPEGYEVFVNGMRHSMFNHRIPVEKISALDVHGDVSMNILGFIDAIPYVGAIPGGMKTDMGVYFQGTVPANAKDFEISFKTGQSAGDDIAFHFKPQLGQKVALNSFRNGTWEKEESASDKPFASGAPFNMFALINPEGYEVFVNGMQHSMFKHRIPIEKISALDVRGDVSMNILGFIDDWSRLSFLKQQKHVISVTSTLSKSPIQLEISHPVINPAIPYVGAIPERIRSDMAVFLQGTVPEKAKDFEINFKTGQSTGDDIAFHFKPQLGQKVALNSFRNGTWEKEESASDKPFASGAPFSMFALINSEGYEVFVNGMRHSMFKHRIPIEKISALDIRGDVSMNVFGFIENWSHSSFFAEQEQIVPMERSLQSKSTVQFEILHSVSNPAFPYVGTIPVGIRPDMAVYIQVTVPANAKGWAKEEQASDKPFERGAPFNMFIVFKSEGYEVKVNGVDHCRFKHRIPLEKVSVLAMLGDLSVQMFGFIMNWSESFLLSQQLK